MVWSLLPARSAPRGVRSVLSVSACAAETAAQAGIAPAIHVRPTPANKEMTCRIRSRSGAFGKMPASCMFASTSEIERRHRGTRLERTTPARAGLCRPKRRSLAGWLLLFCATQAPAALGADLYQDDGWDIRWDNTLR